MSTQQATVGRRPKFRSGSPGSATSPGRVTYRNGRIVPAGDAARMLFPAGGVGLNVGLQDATCVSAAARSRRGDRQVLTQVTISAGG
ncbi:FAD-dependent monooxygenase [Amycolatopsis sp. H6(2020)]|nr:FAD-dependent monooxygenase [Amycolatopsis sp. H6(2020)]